ncbi:MAG: glycoside hydrolase family 2 TIM barrel-domain containing protein [Puniceicoccaceae bacterium]
MLRRPLILACLLISLSCFANPQRTVLTLDGDWQVAESLEAGKPGEFIYTTPVPGLVDMSMPEVESAGVESPLRNYFWYRKFFKTPKNAEELALLKVYKAKYGLKAWINGTELGEHLYNFTAVTFDISDRLKAAGEVNEILLRVGAHPGILPDHIVIGNDFEKIKYLPGLYDTVEIIFSGTPYIENCQVVPRIDDGSIEVLTWLKARGLPEADVEMHYRIFEDTSGKLVAKGDFSSKGIESGFTAKIPDVQLWSPDDPFLYRLEVSTCSDAFTTRFGMREFRFNAETGFAELNGKTIFLRGTNICLYRFFEDDLRGDLPWDREWAKALLQRIKDMHWNSFRFTICLAPEFWYDLCDEMGLLVQDEYPIWYGAEAETYPDALTAEVLVQEYGEWMKERWNHASVVVWDAQNESVTEETGKAIRMVRELDKSDRPWDNGYSPPDRPTDPIESHPYVLQNFLGRKPGPQGPLFEYLSEERRPDNGPSELFPQESGEPYPNPIQNNENVFFWITRDGGPTGLTQYIFKNLYPDQDLTPDDYHRIYSYTFNRIISYWRVYRSSATVQEFCILGYSRGIDPEGFTSDNFIDMENLVFRPYYKDAAYNAFYPVGLLINRWEEWFNPGVEVKIPVKMINDLEEPWKGTVGIKLISRDSGKTVLSFEKSVTINGLGTSDFEVSVKMPDALGDYSLVAEYAHGKEMLQHGYEFSISNQSVEDAESNNDENRQFLHVRDEI